jgi:ADP-ribose pyrophosphatase
MTRIAAEERIRGRRVFHGRVLDLYVDRVRLARGHEATREVVRHPGAVAVVPITNDGDVVLVRQFRYAVGANLLELPAGTLAPGERPLACARRELAEETGHVARRWQRLTRFFSAPGFCDEVLHCYLAMDVRGTRVPQPEEDEAIAVVTLPLAEALDLVERGTIRDSKSIIGLLLAVRQLVVAERPPHLLRL